MPYYLNERHTRKTTATTKLFEFLMVCERNKSRFDVFNAFKCLYCLIVLSFSPSFASTLRFDVRNRAFLLCRCWFLFLNECFTLSSPCDFEIIFRYFSFISHNTTILFTVARCCYCCCRILLSILFYDFFFFGYFFFSFFFFSLLVTNSDERIHMSR